LKLDHKNIGWEAVGCIQMAQNRALWQSLVNTVMKIRVSA